MNRAKLRQQITHHEGLRYNPYRDTMGIWTVGVGRNMEANPPDRELGRTVRRDTREKISHDEAMLLLNNDLTHFINGVAPLVSNFNSLSSPRQHVLIDMAFNLGLRGFRGFQNMIRSVDRRDFTGAAREMLNSTWAGQVGRRARTLADMMRYNHEYDGSVSTPDSGGGSGSGSGSGGGSWGGGGGRGWDSGSSGSGSGGGSSSGSGGGSDRDSGRGGSSGGSSGGSGGGSDRDSGRGGSSGGSDRDSGRGGSSGSGSGGSSGGSGDRGSGSSWGNDRDSGRGWDD